MSQPDPTVAKRRQSHGLYAVSAACLIAVAAYHAWAFGSAHWRTESSLAMACRYLNVCEVCVNKGGIPVCGRARYVEKDLALRVAWFRACERAIPIEDGSEQLATLEAAQTHSLDPCWTEIDTWPLDPSSGFFTMTEAERRCVGRSTETHRKKFERALNDLDGYMRGELASARRYSDAAIALQAARWNLGAKVWQSCVRTFPRYSVECTAASDSIHVEHPPLGLPGEVMTFGR